MKSIYLVFSIVVILSQPLPAFSQSDSVNIAALPSQEQTNKQIAMKFYQDLWMTNNTDRYAETLADEYVVHDTGDRKGVIEPAIEQKIVADRFWSGGQLDFKPEWQIAEGDLVATRWTFDYKAESFMSKIMIGTNSISGINVFRIKDGKIVEIWNHRHDIEANAPVFFFGGKGFLLGLLVALIPTIMANRYRRKLKGTEQIKTQIK
jgi:predicted SnoaL-like aldol condensation-catalyzing enzyme